MLVAMRHMHTAMKPQDVVVLLGTVAMQGPWRHVDLAMALGMSQSEVTNSLERSRKVGLIDDGKRHVFRKGLLEFLEHGIRYVFPAQPGPLVRGVPTAYSCPPLNETIRTDQSDVLVWPSPDGSQRGQAVEPLFPSVPQAAVKNPQLHALLALVDALRLGQARERNLAINYLDQALTALAHAS